MRWGIAILVSAAIAISYFDRQTLPVAIAAIQRDIPISNTQFSELQAAFLIAYALMYVGGGKLIDVLGTRTGFLVVMIWWSLACASHGLAIGLSMLFVSRFMLGLGEGGGFPAATKAVAEWFPVHERSTAMGIMKGGPNPEGARAFVNWWISAEVQSYRAETYGQTVMNREVKLSDAAAAKLPSKDKLAQLVEIDYATVLKNRQAWSDRLQREVQK